VEVGQNQELIGGCDSKISGADQKAGADAASEASLDGRNRTCATQSRHPPFISLRAIPAEHRLKLTVARSDLALERSDIVGGQSECGLGKLQEAGPEKVD
jgi:hypothetical protein